MSKAIFIPDSIDKKLALEILTNELLGTEYCCCDCSCSERQANAMIVRDILLKYTNAEVKILGGTVYGNNNIPITALKSEPADNDIDGITPFDFL